MEAPPSPRPDLPASAPPRPDVASATPGAFPPVPWGILDAVPIFFVNIGVAAFLAAILDRWFVLHGASLFTLAATAESLALAGAVVFWMRYVKPAPLAIIGLPIRPWQDLLIGGLLGAGMLLAAAILIALILSVVSAIAGHTVRPPQRIPNSVHGAWFVVFGPTLFVLAPIAEELFFRGFLYRALRDRFSMWPAIVISAAVFAVAHITPLVIPAIFVDGVILALIYEYRRSLLANIAAHATNNLIIFVLLLHTRT